MAKVYRLGQGFAYLSRRCGSVAAVVGGPPLVGGWLRLIALARSGIGKWASAGGRVQHGHMFSKVSGHVLWIPGIARDYFAQSRVGWPGRGPRRVPGSLHSVVECGCSAQAGARGWGVAGAQMRIVGCGDIVPWAPGSLRVIIGVNSTIAAGGVEWEGRLVGSATSSATDGGTGASWWIFGNLGLQVGLDWCAIESAVMSLVSINCANCEQRASDVVLDEARAVRDQWDAERAISRWVEVRRVADWGEADGCDTSSARVGDQPALLGTRWRDACRNARFWQTITRQG